MSIDGTSYLAGFISGMIFDYTDILPALGGFVLGMSFVNTIGHIDFSRMSPRIGIFFQTLFTPKHNEAVEK